MTGASVLGGLAVVRRSGRGGRGGLFRTLGGRRRSGFGPGATFGSSGSGGFGGLLGGLGSGGLGQLLGLFLLFPLVPELLEFETGLGAVGRLLVPFPGPDLALGETEVLHQGNAGRADEGATAALD